MFKVNPNPTFVGTATIAVPGGEPAKLRLVFKHKTRDEARDFFARAAKSEECPSVVLMEILAGWEDVDEAFSQAALKCVVQNYHTAPQAIFDAYLDELSAARRGN